MSSTVEIIIKAIDKASGELKKVSGSMGALKESAKAAGVVMGGLTAAVGAGVVAWKAVVAPLIDYNKAVLDAGRSTRMGVEDLSRFVQVGDDMGVSMDSITRALQMATKNGFAPSITAIAELADKANAMSTPTERAATLAKMFGRNWAELDPILQLGGQRIREIADAQADGLVVTEEEIEQSETLRLKVDELTDSWGAYRNELAGKAIPVIVDYLDKATEQARISDLLKRAGDLNLATYTEQSYALTRLAMGDESYVKAIEAEIAAHDANNVALMTALGPTEALRVATWGIVGANQAIPEALSAAEQAFKDQTSSTVEGYLKNLEYKAGVDDIAAAIAALRDKSVTINVTTVTEEVTAQTWKWRKDLNTGGPGGPQMAGGADFVVPPGYPNDSFPMRVQSGEHVQVTPAGEKSGANVTINVSSTPMDVQWITKQLKAAVGM